MESSWKLSYTIHNCHVHLFNLDYIPKYFLHPWMPVDIIRRRPGGCDVNDALGSDEFWATPAGYIEGVVNLASSMMNKFQLHGGEVGIFVFWRYLGVY